jgi:hypothetical protein
MMMDEGEGKKKVVVKTEACDLMAGVEDEVGFVNVKGDNKKKMMMINGSGQRIRNDYGFVTSAFGAVQRKKRMARQRRSSSSTITIHLKNLPSATSATTTTSSHVPISPLPPLFHSLPPARVSFLILYLLIFFLFSFQHFRSVFFITCPIWI